MNRHYNTSAARQEVDDHWSVLKRSISGRGIAILSDCDPTRFAITAFEDPACFRVTSEEDAEEEVTFMIIGAICSKVLPPILNKPKLRTDQHLRNLRQFVKITGFGSPILEEAQKKIDAIVERFEGHLGHGLVGSIEPKLWEGDVAVDCHARYFTSRHSAPQQKHLPFETLVDPRNILDDLRGNELIHSADNRVEYCTKSFDDEGAPRYDPCDPSLFKEGDIVEAAITFVCVPVKGGEYKFITTLRALALLSSSQREEAEDARMKEQQRTAFTGPVKRTLKRRLVFASSQSTKVQKTSQQGANETVSADCQMEVE
ncbi:hypothetical protein BKA70DRAFT_1442720 [Coprinopsis sp. MPI-PUGE-AT-0042]|nr:hypothetical protein BKA70DRAFT_1442720 [Coprinopsis sp. MPI-PUGE-AT-0042]